MIRNLSIFLLWNLCILNVRAQEGKFAGEFDYPEINFGLVIPTGPFAQDTYTPTSQQSGYAQNGFAVGLSYHIGFGESIFGYYLNLCYRQMANDRFNDIEQLNPPLRSQNENGVVTRQGQYIFLSFLNGPIIQLNSGLIDPYIIGYFGPSFISGTKTKIKGQSGAEYTYTITGTVGLGRGGEVGVVLADNFKIGVSYLTYGTLQLNIQDGNNFFNSRTLNSRQPISLWQINLTYTWKKN